MPKGKRTRFLVHRDGFQDGTAYVRYEGDSSYLVIVERAERELRSDLQRVGDGHWRELTPKQADELLRQKRGTLKAASLSASAALRALIAEAVDSLFVNGQGERADRLVLTRDGVPPRDLGGWCPAAIVDRLAAALARVDQS